MRLFVANCTMQNHMMGYRLPETSNSFTQPIEALRQVRVGGEDLSMQDIEAFINQQRKYGLVTEEEAKGGLDRTNPVQWVASVDHPVPAKLIERILQHNQGALFMRGKQLREEAAIASSIGMENQGKTPHAAQHMEMSLEEVAPGGGGANAQRDDSLLGEGYRIGDGATPDSAAARPSTRGSKRR